MSSSETVPDSPESDLTQINFDETELTLGLPGAEFRPPTDHKPNAKRCFRDTVDGGVGSSTSEPRDDHDESQLVSSGERQIKRAVMGWPPVRSYRKKTIEMNSKYVKVAADGAPYLRKLDLENFNGYQQLFIAFDQLFPSFPICCDYYLEEEGNNLNPVRRVDEYLPTYEDKDGDWMLVGDVPWKLFIDSCKRIRLMKGSDAIGTAPRQE